MSTTSPAWQLVKPDPTENVDIAVLNNNMDLLDKAPIGQEGRYAQVTADQSGITGGPATNLSITTTLKANRRYKISAFINLAKDATAGFIETRIMKDGVQVALAYTQHASSALGHATPVFVDNGPAAGAHTYRIDIACSLGACDLRAAAVRPCFIMVEDIGGI